MRALQMVEPRRVALLEDVPEPEAGDGEVLVRCQWVSICGSNIHPYLGLGHWGEMEYPKAPGWDGHECVGTIVESRLDGWEPGTTVLAHPLDYTGFADLVRSKPPGLVRLPDGDAALPLVTAQPLATVLRAMGRLPSVANWRCAVVGQGPMGLIFTHLLRSLGARQVISVDLLDWRVEWGKRLGATDGVDASRENVVEAVRELTGGEMVDLSVEAVGYPEALQSAVRLPRRKGTVLQFGVTRFTSAEFPVNHFLRNELVMVASVGAECVHYFGTAVGMLTSGQLDLAPLITHCLPWAEAQRAFDLYADHADGALKVVLAL